MPMLSETDAITAERLPGYEVPGKRVELVRGRLVVREPAGVRHGDVGMRLAYRLVAHLERERTSESTAHRRGNVFGADTGFVLARNPDTVRAPDLAVVLAGRLPDPLPPGYGELAPDLVVEIRSPADRPGPLLAKVGEWLAAGAQLVWVIDPAHGIVTVYRADGSVTVLGRDDVLSGEMLLPGFAVPIGELLTT